MAVALALVMVLPVHVHALAGLSKAIITRMIAEASAIWRDVGVELEFHTDGAAPPSSLRVEVGDEPGRPSSNEWPLAWITFVDGAPDDAIYVSRANAMQLFLASQGMPRLQETPVAMVNEYVGRALGRSLAHEIGHYLFRSTVHDGAGLMGTHRSTRELFGYDRDRFRLTAAERDRLSAVVERYRLAKRTPSPFD